MIPLCPVPLFLQFKIPQIITGPTAHIPPNFTKPYFRMHVRTKRPNQHQLLLDLAATGKSVYYATPDFDRVAQLDEYFTNRSAHLHSRYISRGRIGVLDQKPHFVAYQTGKQQAWPHSKPTLLPGPVDAANFARELAAAIGKSPPEDPVGFLQNVKQDVAKVSRSKSATLAPELPEPEFYNFKNPAGKDQVGDIDARLRRKQIRLIHQLFREIAYLAQVRVGCIFLIAGKNEK